MSEIAFAHPWLLLGLLAFPPIAALTLAGMRKSRARAARLTRMPIARPPYAAATLALLAGVLALFAAARPQWGTEARHVPRVGADLVVVLDVSRSMAARDVAPSRLDAARAAIRAAIEDLDGDRVALVIFAGDARIRFPLTTDLAAAARVLDTMETGQLFVEGGSAAAAALDVAASAFEPGTEAGRLVLLVTDGDDLGPDPAAAARRLADEGISLLVAGAGTPEGATIPVAGPEGQEVSKLDAAGRPIITRLNEPFLRSIAAAGGGRYLGNNLGAIPGAVHSRLDALEQGRIEERAAEVPVERFPLVLGASFVALLLALAAETVRLPWLTPRAGLATVLILGALTLGGCAEKAHLANERGLAALEAGDIETAIDEFTSAQAASPGDLQVTLNLAYALHQSGRYDEAARVVRRATAAADPAIRARAFASIGHHTFAAGDLEASLEAFREALLLQPGDDTYRHDYEVVLRLLTPPQDPGQEPGAGGEAPGGPGDDGEPGEGPTPEPGATPGTEPGDSTGEPGSSPSGGFTTPEQVEDALEQIDEEIRRQQLEAGERPTLAEVLAILDLLAERSRLAALREALDRASGPTDY